MSEEWRPVLGFEGSYEVSSLGRVASLPKPNRPGRRIRATRVSDGYADLKLWARGVSVHRKVSTMVAEAFHGPRPAGMLVRHLDGNRLNDRPTNLKWGTYSENNSDTVAHGRHYNANKDQCKNGHPFSAENTYVPAKQPGKRYCLICRRARDAARIRDRRKASA